MKDGPGFPFTSNSIRINWCHWNTTIMQSAYYKPSLFPCPCGSIGSHALGPRGTGFALRQAAPSPNAGREGLRRFPWRWHPINHSERFSSGSCRVTVDRWTRGRGGKDRPPLLLLPLLPQAHRQTACFPQQSAAVNTEQDFMVNKWEIAGLSSSRMGTRCTVNVYQHMGSHSCALCSYRQRVEVMEKPWHLPGPLASALFIHNCDLFPLARVNAGFKTPSTLHFTTLSHQ